VTTWHPTTPDWYTQTAERVCTPKQLEVLQLSSHELTDSQIGARLGVSRQAVQQRRLSATTSLYGHLSVSGDLEAARTRAEGAA
jgi:DNA-binding NarL/FixJ family response regulator